MDAGAREPIRGRGASWNPDSRFAASSLETLDTGWTDPHPDDPSPKTVFYADRMASIFSKNDSPDIPFTRSINPYRGCEHGCIYCYARPTHEYLGFSSGLDFERRITVKNDAPVLLRAALAKPGYRVEPVAMAGVTDVYQPAERRFQVTRRLLEVFLETNHPVGLITKNALVLRDLDLLAPLAARGLAHVAVSITTLDAALARGLEPRASAPHARLEAVRRLSEAGVPVTLMVAPIIPALTSDETAEILRRGREAGAVEAGYTVLRLPHQNKELFEVWLDQHAPTLKDKVLARLRELRGGGLNDASFHDRMTGTGDFARLIRQIFRATREKLGFPGLPPYRTDLFTPPSPPPKAGAVEKKEAAAGQLSFWSGRNGGAEL